MFKKVDKYIPFIKIFLLLILISLEKAKIIETTLIFYLIIYLLNNLDKYNIGLSLIIIFIGIILLKNTFYNPLIIPSFYTLGGLLILMVLSIVKNNRKYLKYELYLILIILCSSFNIYKYIDFLGSLLVSILIIIKGFKVMKKEVR